MTTWTEEIPPSTTWTRDQPGASDHIAKLSAANGWPTIAGWDLANGITIAEMNGSTPSEPWTEETPPTTIWT